MKTFICCSIVVLCSLLPVVAQPGDRIDPQKYPDSVTLKVGDKGVIVGTEAAGGKINDTKFVAPAKGLAPGVEVNFTREASHIVLFVRNHLARGLFYRAAVRVKGGTGFVETSLVTPVRPGLASYETWQDPLEEIVLFDFREVVLPK